MNEVNFLQILLWAAFLFLGYFGYGELLLRCLNRPEFRDLGWAAKSSLGMGVSVFIGSFLMVPKLANAFNLTAVALVGFGLGAFYLFEWINKSLVEEKKPTKGKGKKETVENTHWPAWIFLLVPAAFTALAFATSIYWPLQYDPNDDWTAYLTFPERILQTGTLIEPFSQRRILGLCGQSLLLAQIMIVAPPESAHLLDRGFGVLLLFGLMVEATRGTDSRWQWLRAVMILAAVTASVPRINTASSQLGIALILAFALVVGKLQDQQTWTWRQSLIPALVLMVASSLRPTFAMAGGGILIFYILWRTAFAPTKEWIARLLPLIQTGLLTIALLVPLMIVSWESSRTPMFPFFKGYAVEKYLYFDSGQGFLTDARVALEFMASPEIVVMMVGLVLALFLRGETRRLAVSVAFTGLLMVFLSTARTSGTARSWVMDLYRYSFPFAAFGLYWVLAKFVENQLGGKWFRHPALAGVALVVFWSTQLVPAAKEVQVQWQVLGKLGEGFKFQVAQLEPFYKELQERVPRGEKIFAVVDAPYLLDYKRNLIDNVDLTGFATVPPGMPFGQGSAALKDYLTGLGYKYAIAVDFNNAVFLYSRQAMSNHQRPEYQEWAKNVSLDFINNMDEIAKNATIAQAGNARLIKLQ
jgi:hypothetical protein